LHIPKISATVHCLAVSYRNESYETKHSNAERIMYRLAAALPASFRGQARYKNWSKSERIRGKIRTAPQLSRCGHPYAGGRM